MEWCEREVSGFFILSEIFKASFISQCLAIHQGSCLFTSRPPVFRENSPMTGFISTPCCLPGSICSHELSYNEVVRPNILLFAFRPPLMIMKSNGEMAVIQISSQKGYHEERVDHPPGKYKKPPFLPPTTRFFPPSSYHIHLTKLSLSSRSPSNICPQLLPSSRCAPHASPPSSWRWRPLPSSAVPYPSPRTASLPLTTVSPLRR